MTTLKKGCRSAMAGLAMLTALTGCRSTSPRYIPMETTVIRTDTRLDRPERTRMPLLVPQQAVPVQACTGPAV